MSQLRGKPRLRGLVRPYASMDGPVEDDWADETVYVMGRDKEIRQKGRTHLRPSYTLTFLGTSLEWLAFRSDMEGGPFPFCARTRAPGDPEWLEEFEPMCRVRGGVRTLNPLVLGDLWLVPGIQIEGVRTYPTRGPGVAGGSVGGYYLLSEGASTYEIEGYGGGSITDNPDGTLTLGNAPVAAARVVDNGDGTLTIETSTPP